MIGRLALIAILAITAAQSCKQNEEYKQQEVADQEFLTKQKLVYDVLFHHVQPNLKENLYKAGEEFDLTKDGSFTDKEAVEYFLRHVKYGLMPHDAVYSVFYYPHETLSVYKVLIAAKDFDTFYKTSLYLRNNVNHDLFAYAFYLAVIHRPDTKYIRLPPLYEMMPYKFYNNELLDKAHHVSFFGKKEPGQNGTVNFVLNYTHSGHYLHDEYDYNYEGLLNYLTEDIGLNEYYFYFRNQLPFLLKSDDLDFYEKYRGEEYLFGHQQILARINLERHANGLSRVEHFDWHGEFYPAYQSTMSYPNGLPFPQRPSNSKIQKSKQHHLDEVIRYEDRIADAIDSGFVLSKDGERVKIYTPEGLNILGNIIEGNADSTNKQYYGDVDRLMRHMLGYNGEPHTRYQAQPSALEQFTTSMRDPAIWRIYFRILHFYAKYNENQGPYALKDIHFHDLNVLSVETNELVTYFDTFDATISNGLVAHSKEHADVVRIKARQSRLNHQPFSINITVHAEAATKASVRIFIGPKYDAHGHKVEFADYAQDFYYQIDNFVCDLKSGTNELVRDSLDYTIDDNEATEDFYDRVVKALESNEEFKYEKRISGFPNRLLLPKGKSGGLPLQMFVHVAKVKGEPRNYESRIFGNSVIDNRSFGYPLDRPMIEHDFHSPNMFYKEVRVYHRY